MNSNVWFYGLSSIIQASASLLSLFAVFVIFKIDKTNKAIDDFENLVIPEVVKATHKSPLEYIKLKSDKLIEEIDKFVGSGFEIHLVTILGKVLISKENKQAVEFYKKLNNTKKEIINYLLIIIVVFSAIISCAIIALVWSSYNRFWLQICVVGFVIGINTMGYFIYKISSKQN